MTTHYLEEAESADDVAIINHGRVAAHGTPAQVKAALVDEYVELDAADRATLGAELAALGQTVEGAGPFRLNVGTGAVHELLRAVQTPLTEVRTHAPTLEDAYLALIGVEEE